MEEEDEDEGSQNLQPLPRSGRSEDDMATVSMAEFNSESEGSETSIRRMEGSFDQKAKPRRASMSVTKLQRNRMGQAFGKKSFASDAGNFPD